MKFWVQTQAPAGNWVDSLGCNQLEDADSFAKHLVDTGHKVRLVIRTDVTILEY